MNEGQRQKKKRELTIKCDKPDNVNSHEATKDFVYNFKISNS